MYRFERVFIRLVGYVCSALFFLMVLVSLLQVFFRYALNDSLTWSEELARYLFVWTSFLGAAIALHRGMHIEVDILTSVASAPVRKGMHLFSKAAVVVFLVMLIVYGVRITMLTWGTPSAALRVPMGLVYLAIPVGAASMLVILLLQMGQGTGSSSTSEQSGERSHGSLYTN